MSTGTIIAILVLLLLFFLGMILEMVINIFSASTFGTDRKVLKEISKIIIPKKGSTVIDLGCGDGRVLIELAKKNEVVAKGYDISPIRLYLGKVVSFFTKKVGTISFEVGSIYHVDVSDADYIYINLNERTIKKLEENIKGRVKAGAYLFSYEYPLERRSTREYLLSNKRRIFYYKF
jgi:SAM-dependent methyltransferase